MTTRSLHVAQFTDELITMSQNLLLLRSLLKHSAGLMKTAWLSVVPCPCLLCGSENRAMICSACRQQFFTDATARCFCCAVPLNPHDRLCGACLSDAPAFQRTWVACNYEPPLDQLVLSLKFGHQLAVAPSLARLLAASVCLAAEPDPALPDLLIPVPLSRERLAQRGFNQALEIARPLARLLHLPLYPRLLVRVRDTTAQSLLHPNQRRKNILHAFVPDGDYEDKIRHRHVGVVDDVMTTGATLHEIAACLKRHGARQVSNLVFARTPPH